MKVRRYTAATMQEAIDQIRQELGPNAVILHSRKIARGGVLNLLGKPVIEVTAAVDAETDGARDDQAVSKSLAESTTPSNGTANRPAPADHRLASYFAAAERPTTSFEPNEAAAAAKPTGVVETIRRQLIGNDVDSLLAEALLRSAVQDLRTSENEGLIKEYIEKRIERFMRVTGPLRLVPGMPKIIAIAGPTGVGKTTTLAKLAAHYSGFERKKVAIITVDVTRVAGVEQMRVYANQLKVPIDVVLTPADLKGTVAAHNDKDLILVDTGGRSPYNWMQVLELASFLKELPGGEIHLALSAATRSKENLAVVERFSPLDVNSMIFTKLDETRDYGSLLTLAIKSKRPISYLTTGQEIPRDIEPASASKLARMILRTEIGHQRTSFEADDLNLDGVESHA